MNLHQSLYNFFREDLDIFKACFTHMEAGIEENFSKNQGRLEAKMESLGLGSEGLIHARKLKQ